MPAPTLLAVDDDPAALARLREDLGDDYRVLVTASLDEALAILARERPAVLMTGLRLPGGSGLELAARAHRSDPELPVIVLAGGAAPDELIGAINAGDVVRWLHRPWDAANLRATVRRVIELAAQREERAVLVEQLQRRLEALSILNEVAAAAGELGDHAEVIRIVTSSLPRVLRCDVAAAIISLDEAEGAVLHLHCQAPIDAATLTRTRDRCVEQLGAATGRAVREDRLILNLSGERAREAPRAPGATSSTHVPLLVEGHTVGLLLLFAFRPLAFTPEDEKILHVLATETSEVLRRLSVRQNDERRRMSLMVESMADGVIMTDDRNEVFLINPAARRLLGIADDVEVTTKYLKEHLGFYPFDLLAANARVTIREELRIGDKTLHSIVSPVVDPGGRLLGVVVDLRDITEWKELGRRKEEFVSVVSHELRTPLTSIAGALDIVLKEYAGGVSDKQRRYLQLARDSCSKLNLIVDDLLDVARFERGRMPMQFRPIGLDRLAVECVDRFRAAAEEKRIVLQLRAERPDIRIIGDADRLAQVLHNLISNAIKFTPEGGRVEVEVFGPRIAAGHVGVSVWNNGEAIPEEARERVFDKFEQVQASTTRRVGGTGLGLAISRSIVEGHGGRIWVENAPAGTKFVFTLPAAPEPASVEAPPLVPGLAGAAREGEAAAVPSGATVLVVDDDRYSTYILKGVLMAAGHRVLVAHDADEALSLARERKPDLVTVDVMIPGVDGLAVVEILKHDPDTRKAPVLVVSAGADRERTIGAGADALLPKPVDVDTFRETCARLLAERGREAPPRVLVVDDDPGIRMICREVLEKTGYVVREAADGMSALAEAKRYRPDLLLLDVMMPDLDGFQTAQRFRAEHEGLLTPVIFVSARGQTADKVRAFKLGADDYLVKPFDAAELVARVEKALERREREIGTSPTTRLPGAGAIESEISRRLAEAAEFAFCYLDLDNLKAFNDHYGYAKADGVIRQTGDIVREAVARAGGPGDFIGHIAGDDFVFMTTPDRVDALCRSICRTFDRLIPLYYDREDRERGFIETLDRYGALRKFPIMTVSVAALTTRAVSTPVGSFAELAAAAAEAKKHAKSIPGSSYVRDGQVILPPATGAATA